MSANRNPRQARNLERYRAAHELRRSNAARPHRNRAREAARGITKGGRSGSRVVLLLMAGR